MLRSRRVVLLTVGLSLLIFSGCRTYGGYGVQEKTYEAMQTTVQLFESDLERANADLNRLEEAAAQAEELQAVVDRYRHLIAEHESLLATQRHRLERLSPESDARTLHGAYGATVTERRMLRQKYQRATADVQAVVQGTTAAAAEVPSARHYRVTPIGFPTDEPGDLTMEQALHGL